MKLHRRSKFLAASMALFLGLSATFSQAGPANAKHVGADAKWYIHLDAESAKQSTLFKQALDLLGAQFPVEDAAAQIKTAIGIDPLKDITGITVYSNTFEKDVAAILIYAKADKNLLTQAVAQNPEHKEQMHGVHMLHTWVDNNDGKTKAGCFWGEDVIIMADKIETLKYAVEVLDGKQKNESALVKQPAKGSFLNASAHLAQAGDQNLSQLLSNSDAASAFATESDGKLMVNLNVTAKSADQAAQLNQMLMGVKAFAEMGTKDTPVTNGLLKQVKVAMDGAKIGVSFTHDSKTIIETLQSIDAEHKAKAAKAVKP